MVREAAQHHISKIEQLPEIKYTRDIGWVGVAAAKYTNTGKLAKTKFRFLALLASDLGMW